MKEVIQSAGKPPSGSDGSKGRASSSFGPNRRVFPIHSLAARQKSRFEVMRVVGSSLSG